MEESREFLEGGRGLVIRLKSRVDRRKVREPFGERLGEGCG